MKPLIRPVSQIVVAAACLAAGFFIGIHRENIAGLLHCRGKKVCFAGQRGALVGKIYYPPSLFKRRYPGILFVHGLMEKGKGAKVYSHLMGELARKGYLVMGFDLRGFGESRKMATFRIPGDLDFVADTEAALAYMLRELPVDRGNVTIVGHSMGANLVFAVGARDRRVKNIVMISAGDYRSPEKYPIRVKQHFVELLDHAIHADLTLEDWDRLEQPLILFQYLPLPDPKNVFIIITDCEAAGTTHYNKKFYRELNARKELLVIRDSNHYLGFDQIKGNESVDPRPVRVVAAAIERWIRNSPKPNVESLK
jgi:pimeloyl-ACP methyl ester carboxylesterase